MKHLIQIFILLTTVSAFSAHPRIYTSAGDNSELKAKIAANEWAASNYKNIKATVEPYVQKHKTDPQWIVSRLQMYWKNQYSDVYVNGAVFSHGEGNAGVPTPKFAGARDWAVDYLSPSLEEIQPYSDDERGMWLQNDKKEGKPWEWAPLDKTGQIIERINERIMTMAENAAFIYWLTGDEDYARFAADIFWTYTNGMYHRGNPKFYKDDRSKQIVGLATFEVIHEAITVPLAVTYDYIYDYLIKDGKDVKIAQSVFQRWADRIIEGGGSEGNWNINQARYIVFMGLALEDNSLYSDGKGKEYYLDSFLKTNRPNQKPLPNVINDQYDPDQAIWPEAPGYAFSVTETLLKLANIIKNATGNDILKDYPIIEKAYLAYFQYLFPNGYSVGFGDTYHDRPNPEPLELLVSLYHSRGDEKMEAAITAVLKEQIASGYNRSRNSTIASLTTYVGKLADTAGQKAALQTPTYYSRPVNMFIQRNGDDPQTALCATLTGTAGGHTHANGMTMELYGLGMVMAPDAGRGTSYWQKEQGEYYAKYPAHNTVIVDGISNYNANRDDRNCAYRIEACEPQPESLDRVNDNVSFIDAAFVDIKTNADQKRTNIMIRTGLTSGYYVDVFRSAKRSGDDKFNDYLIHLVGNVSSITDNIGKPIDMKPTNLLSSKRGLIVGYDYFKDEKAAAFDGDLNVVVDVPLGKRNDPAMRMWNSGYEGTTVFTAKAPRSRAAGRGAIPSVVAEEPLSTIIVRRTGQAQTKPFVCVYEPFMSKDGSAIDSIKRVSDDDNLVVLEIKGKTSTQYILSSACDHQRYKINDIEFEGSLAVVSFDKAQDLEYLYLGSGRFLSAAGYGIDAGENMVSAGINLRDGQMLASSDTSVRIMLPVKNQDVKANIEGFGDNTDLKPRYFENDGRLELSVRIQKCFNAVIDIN